MSATFFLVRHASHDLLGRVLAGRMEGVGLSAAGRAEADRLAGRLARQPVAAVHSSPMLRARETAEAIAGRHGRPVEVRPPLDEIDFGDWTGARFDALESDPRWQSWNTVRSLAAPPGGELMRQAQARAIDHVLATAAAFPDAAVVLVSHQDIIKSVLAHLLGLSLDALERFEIAPASVSSFVLGDWGAKVLSINEAVAE